MELIGAVNIRSSLPLEELAALISESICAGVKFGGLEEFVREEVPAVYSMQPFLGLRLVLFGEPGDYGLTVEDWDEPEQRLTAEEIVDISPHIVAILKKLSGIEAY